MGPVVVEILFSGNQACMDVGGGFIEGAVLRDISEDPERFYVDIHSRRYPGGAARGQLELAQ